MTVYTCCLLTTITVYPKKYAHGFCFAVLCCGYTLTEFPISIRLTSLALWQSNDCPSASKATLMNMDKNFMWIHYERLHNHNKAKHNKTVCIFLGIYCISSRDIWRLISQEHVSRTGTSNYNSHYLWDVITRPFLWQLLLANEPSYCIISTIHTYPVTSIWLHHFNVECLSKLRNSSVFQIAWKDIPSW